MKRLSIKEATVQTSGNWVLVFLFSAPLQYLWKIVWFFVRNVLIVCSQEQVNIYLFPRYLMNARFGFDLAVIMR